MNTIESSSLLGGSFPPELEAKLAKEREQVQQMVDRVGAWMELLLEGYRSGELRFEQYAKLCRSIIHANTPSNQDARNRWLGEAISAALDATPRSRGKGNKGVPQSIRAAALGLLEMVRENEGAPLSRTPDNAYVRCCELFKKAGYRGISWTELEKWRSEAKNTRVTE